MHATFFFLFACSPDTSEEIRYEGDDAGECSDGADNDRDGLFDCDDRDCSPSPDCSDADADADTDTDTDADTDQPYVGVEVDYRLLWDFDTIWEQSYGLTDCELVFAGVADVEGGGGVGVYTFWGMWRLESSDCPETLGLEAVVWHPASEEAYTSLHLSGGVLDAWVVHEHQEESAAAASLDGSGKYYIYDMGAVVDGGEASHLEQEDVYESGFLLATLTHDLAVRVVE